MAFCDCLKSEEIEVSEPAKPRKCTDLLCLCLFLLFWALLIFISAFAFVIGSPSRLIHGTDSFGNDCGHKNEAFHELELSGLDMTDKPYVFHLDQNNPKTSIKICVKSCPTIQLNNIAEIYSFYTQTNSSLCRYDFDFVSNKSPFDQFERNDQQMSAYSSTGPCPSGIVFPTKAILYRCVPELAVSQGYALGHSVYDYISSYAPLKKIVNDLINSYKEMSIMILVAIISAFGSAFLIHFIAGIASWIIMTLVSISLIGLTLFLWYAYVDVKLNLDKLSLEEHIPILQEDQDNEQLILITAIVVSIVSLILLLITFALRTRVKFVVALFKEAAACIRAMPLLLLQPLWTLIALTVCFLFCLSVLFALSTADHAAKEKRNLQALRYDSKQMEPSNAANLASFTLINYNNPSWIQYMWWYLIIAFIWTSEFILSCQQMVIAGAVSKWYFTRDKSKLFCPIGHSIRRLFLYHMGSIALGSFLITLLKVPRLIISYTEKKLRNYDNFAVKCCLRCCVCCLWIIEKFVRYLNRNAYTVIAIEGSSFCTSAQIAFNAIVTNALRVAAINSVGDFVLFLGKISVAAIAALVGAFLMKNNPMLHYWTIPVLVVSVFAFWIAHCILSVYEMVIDTLFLCFCEDYNRNDGTPGKEYYSPPSLLEFLSGEEVDTALQPLRSKRSNSVDV